MYQLVVFDMDGTLADTSAGILNSHRHAHAAMGRPVPSANVLSSVIGGPLLQTYIERFGFCEEEARIAVRAYREYYSSHGIHEACLYPGMAQALRRLRQQGLKIGLATLKAERFAKEMLTDMGVSDCFDAVYGVDESDTRTKSQLIDLCIKKAGTPKIQTIMVGDSIHDRDGARACGVDFMCVTYGFGFLPDVDPYQVGAVAVAHSCAEIFDFFLTTN